MTIMLVCRTTSSKKYCPAPMFTDWAFCNVYCSELVRKVPAFRMCSEPFIRSIVTKLRPQVCLPGDYIVAQGDRPLCMFFGEIKLPVFPLATGCQWLLRGLIDASNFAARRLSHCLLVSCCFGVPCQTGQEL